MTPLMDGESALMRQGRRHIELETPYYPAIVVPMVDEDGNAFAILGRCKQAIHQGFLDGHFTREEADDLKHGFLSDAMDGDYVHLLATVMKYFDVE